MYVKGNAWVAREAMLMAQFGAERWKSWFAAYAEKNPYFRQPILPISRIPTDEFLPLNDAIIAEFYGGDSDKLWQFGMASGEYALSKGQLKGLFQSGELKRFLQFCPNIYKSYCDGGQVTLEQPAPNLVDLTISGVPSRHVYFEYVIIGFAAGGMRFLQAKHPDPERLRGFSAGNEDVCYRFRLD